MSVSTDVITTKILSTLILTIPENTITYHNALCHPEFCISIVFSFSWELKWPLSEEKLKTILMQNFGVTKKEHYDMLWCFLKWSIAMGPGDSQKKRESGLN